MVVTWKIVWKGLKYLLCEWICLKTKLLRIQNGHWLELIEKLIVVMKNNVIYCTWSPIPVL